MRVLLHGLGFRQIHIYLVVGSFLSCCKIYIQVDVQFAHQTVIIGIALPVIWIMGMIILMRKVVASEIVLCIHPHIIMRFKLIVTFHSGTQRVLVVNLPVESEIIIQALSLPVIANVAILKNIPNTFISLKEGRLRNTQIVRTIPFPIVNHTKQVQIVVTITQV